MNNVMLNSATMGVVISLMGFLCWTFMPREIQVTNL